jgi:hypothetical protein
MVEYHDNGNKSYEFITDKNGLIEEKTFDKNQAILSIKNSNGFIYLWTRDDDGNELAFKDRYGIYEIKGKEVTQRQYEAFIQSLEKPKQLTAVEWVLERGEDADLTEEIWEKIKVIALEKEKQQTLLGVYEGQKNHSASDEENKKMAEFWYNEIFKK